MRRLNTQRVLEVCHRPDAARRSLGRVKGGTGEPTTLTDTTWEKRETEMTESWTCPECKSEYEVRVMNIGSREHEKHGCEVCGNTFVDGKIAKIYIPVLKKCGTAPKHS